MTNEPIRDEPSLFDALYEDENTVVRAPQRGCAGRGERRGRHDRALHGGGPGPPRDGAAAARGRGRPQPGRAGRRPVICRCAGGVRRAHRGGGERCCPPGRSRICARSSASPHCAGRSAWGTPRRSRRCSPRARTRCCRARRARRCWCRRRSAARCGRYGRCSRTARRRRDRNPRSRSPWPRRGVSPDSIRSRELLRRLEEMYGPGLETVVLRERRNDEETVAVELLRDGSAVGGRGPAHGARGDRDAAGGVGLSRV